MNDGPACLAAGDGVIALTGRAEIDGGFVAGNASTGATFNCSIQSNGSLAGTGVLPPDESGTFSGTRTIAPDASLDHDLIEMKERWAA